MLVWALEVAPDGKPRHVVHLGSVIAKRSRGGIYETGKFAETACGRELEYKQWADAECVPSDGVTPTLCAECSFLTLADVWADMTRRET